MLRHQLGVETPETRAEKEHADLVVRYGRLSALMRAYVGAQECGSCDGVRGRIAGRILNVLPPDVYFLNMEDGVTVVRDTEGEMEPNSWTRGDVMEHLESERENLELVWDPFAR